MLRDAIRWTADYTMASVERGWVPREIDPETRNLVATTLAHFEAYLKPVETQWLTGRITALLAHYYVPDMPVALHQAVLTDWVEALRAFPKWAVERACRDWLSGHDKRPTISAIVRQCEEATSGDQARAECLRKLVAPALKPHGRTGRMLPAPDHAGDGLDGAERGGGFRAIGELLDNAA